MQEKFLQFGASLFVNLVLKNVGSLFGGYTNSTVQKTLRDVFAKKIYFFLSQLTCWLSSTNLIPSGTLGLCCAHIVRLMTLQQFCAWLFTLQLCY